MITFTKKQFEHGLFESKWGYVAIIFLISGVFLSTYKLFTPYSYWFDELFSVNLSGKDLASLYKLLLSDTHPPLYPLLLKGWMLFFGDSEFSARSLSWLFAVASIYPVWKFSKRYGVVFLVCSLIFFSTNDLFIFFANEARPYATVLFFSSIVVTSYLSDTNQKVSYAFLISCLLLSLSHYFGLILAGIVLLFCLVDNLKNKSNLIKIISAGALSLLWPIHHALNGTILNRTGGKFWLKINGIVDSFRMAASGFIPHLGSLDFYLLIKCVFAAVVAEVLIILYGRHRRVEIRSDAYTIALKVALMWICFLSLVALIDLHTPISLRRYYIVLLPLVTLLLSFSVYFIYKIFPKTKNPLLVIICIFGLLALKESHRDISLKSSAPQDWKNAIKVALKNADGREFYFRTEEGIVDFYLDKYSSKKLTKNKYTVGETKIKEPAVLIYGHINPDELERLKSDMSAIDGKQIFPQVKVNTLGHVGVFLID